MANPTIFYPMGLYRTGALRPNQKPRQWGPLSAVQSAVRWNADRLGLPAPIHLLVGAWSFYDVMVGSHPVDASSPPTIAADAYVFDRASFQYLIPSKTTTYDYVNNDYSLYVFCKIDFEAADNRTIISVNNTTFATDTYRTSIDQRFRDIRSIPGNTRYEFPNYDERTISAVSAWEGNDNYLDFVSTDGHSDRVAGVGVVADRDTAFFNNRESWSLAAVETSDDIELHNSQTVYISGVFPASLSARQATVLHEQPYALIQPYTPPVWFDLAAGGGTTESLAGSLGTLSGSLSRQLTAHRSVAGAF